MPVKIEEYIEQSIKEYPTLFQTRWQVLNHLFCVLGNGYEWHKGILRSKGRRYEKKRKVETLSEQVSNELRYRKRYNKKSRLKIFDERLEKVMDNVLERRHKLKNHIVDFYTLCESSCLLKLPDDIRPDWLRAAREVTHLIFFTSMDDGQRNYAAMALRRIKELENVQDEHKVKKLRDKVKK